MDAMTEQQITAIAFAKMALAHTVAAQGPLPRKYILEDSPEKWETLEAKALRDLIAAFPQDCEGSD